MECGARTVATYLPPIAPPVAPTNQNAFVRLVPHTRKPSIPRCEECAICQHISESPTLPHAAPAWPCPRDGLQAMARKSIYRRPFIRDGLTDQRRTISLEEKERNKESTGIAPSASLFRSGSAAYAKMNRIRSVPDSEPVSAACSAKVHAPRPPPEQPPWDGSQTHHRRLARPSWQHRSAFGVPDRFGRVPLDTRFRFLLWRAKPAAAQPGRRGSDGPSSVHPTVPAGTVRHLSWVKHMTYNDLKQRATTCE